MTHQPSAARRLAWDEICARRIERHGLSAPLSQKAPAEIVATICGAHAQILTAAELSVAQRIAGLTRADLHDALWVEHSLIKSYGPRGTVHLLPAHELAMWCGALTALPATQNAFAPDVRLTPEQTEQVIEATGAVLAEAELTIDELTEAIVAATGAWAGDRVMPAFQEMWPRWRQVMHLAAQRGLLCFAPNRGRKVTYTNPQRWLPGFAPMEAEAALAALLNRYLAAYGPATSHHFAQWLAVPRRWASEQFEALGNELERVEVDGVSLWQVAGDEVKASAAAKGVRLLPYFDAYVVGCHPREQLFPGRAGERALAKGQAGNFPVLLVDGIAAGVWHQRRSGRTLQITVECFTPLDIAQRSELDDQVERVAAFFDAKPRLTLGQVTVGPHA